MNHVKVVAFTPTGLFGGLFVMSISAEGPPIKRIFSLFFVKK